MSENSDLNTEQNLKRIDDLETFRKEFEGKEFDKKVLLSMEESSKIQEEVKKLAWCAVKDKIIWILIGGALVIITDLVIRAIPNILKSVAG